MGQSTNGQICYGVKFEEDTELPWGELDWEEWWRSVRGYKRPFQLYDDNGEYIDGKRPPENKISEYFHHQRDWDAANPMPVTMVNYCSGECPMYILAVPSSVKVARRGYPEEIDPLDLAVAHEEVEPLLAFIREYMPAAENPEPKWYLSSYWG